MGPSSCLSWQTPWQAHWQTPRAVGSQLTLGAVGQGALGDRVPQKIEKRFEEYGCVRSKRNLVGGKCPAAAGK